MPPHADNTPLAVGALVIGLFALSLGDAIIKYTSAQYTLWQIFTLRSAFALPMLFGMVYFLHRSAFNSLAPRAPKWIAIRSLLFIMAASTYFPSLLHLPFSVAAAMLNTAPLLVAWFAAWFGGERLAKGVWFALALGFGGMLLIIRPDASEFNGYALLPLATAVFYALAMVVTRVRCRRENPYTLAFSLHLAFIAVGVSVSFGGALINPSAPENAMAQFLLARWSTLGARDWLVMIALGLIFTVYMLGAAYAYQRARAALIAPFEYAYLAFGLLWGFWIFTERPAAVSLIGMLMIFVAGWIAIKHQPQVGGYQHAASDSHCREGGVGGAAPPGADSTIFVSKRKSGGVE